MPHAPALGRDLDQYRGVVKRSLDDGRRDFDHTSVATETSVSTLPSAGRQVGPAVRARLRAGHTCEAVFAALPCKLGRCETVEPRGVCELAVDLFLVLDRGRDPIARTSRAQRIEIGEEDPFFIEFAPAELEGELGKIHVTGLVRRAAFRLGPGRVRRSLRSLDAHRQLVLLPRADPVLSTLESHL
ncbi:MAG: hypothetical protein JRF63_04900, partial [Deltaproteobacteria bacterium]|nr:hypothetical protein [Deltaproteobacteria bacterium]